MKIRNLRSLEEVFNSGLLGETSVTTEEDWRHLHYLWWFDDNPDDMYDSRYREGLLDGRAGLDSAIERIGKLEEILRDKGISYV